jgi:predicted lipoprotein with Yx(FWY)xxD motif
MTASKCTSAQCVKYWPPVLGKPSLAAGVKLMGKLGTIKRANGQLQATYMGHPLYTFLGDSGGKITGNAVNANGGLWWAMTTTGAKLPKAAPASAPSSSASSSSSSGGSGGYGY